MKQTIKITLSLLLVLTAFACLMSCNKVDAEGLWADATYRGDTALGEGSKEVMVDVVIEEQFITITLKTDADNLGQALYDEGITNDVSFFDTVNGIKADWNAHKAYWAFYKGEEYMTAGVAETEISDGEHYRLVYSK